MSPAGHGPILDLTQGASLDGSRRTWASSRQRQDSPARAPYRIVTDGELASLPAPRELIEGILVENSLSVLVGPTSTFKSFLLLDWSLSIQLGIDWNGRAVRRGNVLYIYAEGRSGLPKRVAAWRKANHVDATTGIRFLPESVILTEPDEVDRFVASAMALHVQFDLVVIDTLNRCFRGNENSAEDMTRFIEGCDRIRRQLGAAVLVAHHSGWEAPHSRGSSALPAALDSEFTVRKDGDRIRLTSTKSKDSEPFPPISLGFFQVAETGSGVLKPVDVRAHGLSQNQLRALRALGEITNNGPVASGHWNTQTQMVSSSFHDARRVLLQELYVVTNAQHRYALTDAGREQIRTSRQP